MSTTNNVTAAIIQYLRMIGGLAWRNNTGSFVGEYTDRQGETRRRFVRYGEKGSGDVLALHRGKFYSIEVKTGRDKLRPEQAAWIEAVNEAGGCAFVAYSIDDVIERVKA